MRTVIRGHMTRGVNEEGEVKAARALNDLHKFLLSPKQILLVGGGAVRAHRVRGAHLEFGGP